MTSPLFTGPQAPERNPPIEPQFYSPRIAVISSITPLSQSSTQIVTSEANQFVVGQLIRFLIAPRCGMGDLNQQEAYVTQIVSDTTFYASVDVTLLNSFNPLGNPFQNSFVVPVGDTNSGQINSSGRINNIVS